MNTLKYTGQRTRAVYMFVYTAVRYLHLYTVGGKVKGCESLGRKSHPTSHPVTVKPSLQVYKFIQLPLCLTAAK